MPIGGEPSATWMAYIRDLAARLAASRAMAREMAEALACELGHGRCSKCSPDGGFPDYDTHATALTRYQEATR